MYTFTPHNVSWFVLIKSTLIFLIIDVAIKMSRTNT